MFYMKKSIVKKSDIFVIRLDNLGTGASNRKMDAKFGLNLPGNHTFWR